MSFLRHRLQIAAARGGSASAHGGREDYLEGLGAPRSLWRLIRGGGREKRPHRLRIMLILLIAFNKGNSFSRQITIGKVSIMYLFKYSRQFYASKTEFGMAH